MSSDVPEMRALVSALTAKIQGIGEALNAQAISNSLYGLCGLVSGSDSSAIFERLVEELDRTLGAPASLSSSERRDLMRSLLLFRRYSRVIGADDSLKSRVDRLRACLPSLEEAKVRGSRAVREMCSIVERLLPSQNDSQPGGGCTIESNVWLDGCFEADIVITRVTPDGSKSVFNIEVDGPSHSLPTSQRLCQRRDQYLQEACGVRVTRIPLIKPTGEYLKRGAEYEATVREVLEGLQLLLPLPA